MSSAMMPFAPARLSTITCCRCRSGHRAESPPPCGWACPAPAGRARRAERARATARTRSHAATACSAVAAPPVRRVYVDAIDASRAVAERAQVEIRAIKRQRRFDEHEKVDSALVSGRERARLKHAAP